MTVLSRCALAAMDTWPAMRGRHNVCIHTTCSHDTSPIALAVAKSSNTWHTTKIVHLTSAAGQVLPLIILTALSAGGMAHLYRAPTAVMAVRAAVDADAFAAQVCSLLCAESWRVYCLLIPCASCLQLYGRSTTMA